MCHELRAVCNKIWVKKKKEKRREMEKEGEGKRKKGKERKWEKGKGKKTWKILNIPKIEHESSVILPPNDKHC